MSLWVAWIILGILFLIAEIFFLTGDFLALGISALLTGFLVKFLKISFIHNLVGSSIIFLIISVIVWFITKYFVRKLDKNSPNTPVTFAERIVGQILIVQLVDGKKAVFFEGMYFPIINEDDVNIGDKVKVVSFENNSVKVEKVL